MASILINDMANVTIVRFVITLGYGLFDFEVSFRCSFLYQNFALKLSDMISVCFRLNMVKIYTKDV